VKKTLVVVLAIAALAVTGCKKKEEAPQGQAPQGGVPTQQAPAGTPGGDPHAGLKPQEIPAGAGHKGKVLETMDSGGYTYAQVEENGQKLWVAVMQTKVKVGDTVEFPDSPPMVNFQSKTLKRTFDKIIFAPGLRIVK
jgi:hypothetical protein